MHLKLAAFAAINMFLLTSVLPAQSSRFEAAIIRKNTSGQANAGPTTTNGQLRLANVTLSDLLAFAYGLKDSAIICTGWTRTDRFDLSAKAPAGTPDADLPRMLQSLLADDFQLQVHDEMRPQDAYALLVAKGGPKLQAATDLTKPGCTHSVVNGRPHADCRAETMARFADDLRRLAPGYFDRPVVDLTTLKGAWDFNLDWVGISKVAEGGLTIFDAVNKQLGLRLDQQKLPAKALVVDHAEHLQQ